MSNWEARQLSARQVQYAALDAVITGHLYRGLRLWHASPSACASCRQMLGAVSRLRGSWRLGGRGGMAWGVSLCTPLPPALCHLHASPAKGE